jgi:dihydrofolate reductase
MSRLVTYGAACSLDGFIAGADGSVDWLHFSDDVREILEEYWAGIDTVLMGRKTWEVAAASGGGGSPYGPVKCYVFSRTLSRDAAPGAEVVPGDAGRFVRDLKQRRGKNICVMGGGQLARSLLAEGVIDEVGLNVHPLLLGSGVPLFLDPGRSVQLDLVECRRIAGGCAYLTYRVRAREGAA